MNDEERLKVETETVERYHNKKNSVRWDEFVKVMGETDVFDPRVFKNWKQILIRLDAKIKEYEQLVKESKAPTCADIVLKELKFVKEKIEDESPPQVSIVSRKVHL